MLKIILKSPIYYHVPIYNFLSELGGTIFSVYYSSRVGIEPYADQEMPDVTRVWITDDDLVHPHEFVRTHKLSRWDGGFWNRLSPGILWTIFRGSRGDVFLLQGFSNLDEVLALLLTKIMRKKVIFRGEGYIDSAKLNGFSPRASLKRKIKQFLLGHVKLFLFSTQTNREYIAYVARPDAKMFFFPSISQPVKHSETGVEPRKKTANSFVIASRLTERKCVPDSLRLLLRTLPEAATVTILGDGPDRDAVLEFKEAFRCKRISFNFLGFRDHQAVIDVFKSSRFYVNLSDYDPSPKALNEATDCGCSVILSSGVGTYKDLQGRASVLVLNKDAWKDGQSDSELPEFIEKESRSERAELSGFTVADCAKGLRDAYKQALRN